MTARLDTRTLFGDHRLALRSFLRRMTGDGDLADDLCQEVFVRAVRAERRYDERGQAKAWLFTIARRLVADDRRSKARRPIIDALDEATLPAARTDGELGVALDQALETIEADQREAFLLREVGGLGYVEIAGAVGATPAAVRSRIHRARLALRQRLAAPLAEQRTRRGQETR